MAEARITQFFGETQTDGRSVRIREEVLDFVGLGSCMPREAWRLPSPQPLHHKQLRQSLQHGVQLHKELADEPLMRRQLENECTQEQQKRIGPNTPISYENRVYAWLTKQISKGQKGDEWLKYCGKHVDPFRHSENSLLAFLRHQGTVRDAAVFHHLRAPPWENVAPQTTPPPPPDVPTHKDILQAIEQSESAWIVDLVGSSQKSASPPVSPSSALSLVGPEGDDVHTLLKEAQESFVDLWQTTFPDKELV